MASHPLPARGPFRLQKGDPDNADHRWNREQIPTARHNRRYDQKRKTGSKRNMAKNPNGPVAYQVYDDDCQEKYDCPDRSS